MIVTVAIEILNARTGNDSVTGPRVETSEIQPTRPHHKNNSRGSGACRVVRRRPVQPSCLLPILFQHQLVYPVGVKHLMHQQVPEHYVHRVMAERLMLGRPLPILRG